MREPEVGQLVNFQYGDEVVAATITQVLADNAVYLTTFIPPTHPGLYDEQGNPLPIPYADTPTDGHWNWPPE
ncbi:hypothetical protein [Nocardia transvalensis]|uniref:hypothetical protein n=1 Tax=Nocardia transvalensis TaxID=37333 RepID=UPI00031701B1|nr:hypothetical protein [Nocardia transvalensis]